MKNEYQNEIEPRTEVTDFYRNFAFEYGAKLEQIKSEVEQKTPERKRSILGILTESPIQMKGDRK